MMNLQSLLNSNDDGNGNTPSNPSPPQHQRQELPPTTPVQTNGPFRDYSSSVHASPRPQPQGALHEYGVTRHTSVTAHASPSAATMTPGGGMYGARPAPPSLQTMSVGGDMRSPSTGSSIAVPSPYRQTPGSSMSGAYTFPPGPAQSSAVSSPVMHQQGPPQPLSTPYGYTQPSGPVGLAGPPGAPPYMQAQQQQSIPPQTPGGGAPSPYHQRSHSFQSTPPQQPAPPSAQSQHRPLHPSQQQQQQPQQHQSGPYGSYGQASPTVAHRQAEIQKVQVYQQQQQLLQQLQHQQPQSQPFDPIHQTQPIAPLGPPLSGGPQRAYSNQILQPPASPMQPRVSSLPVSSSVHPGYGRMQDSVQASPPAPHASSLPAREVRPSFAHQGSGHGHPSVSDSSHGRSLSRSDRTASVSVSPKTQISSLPSSAGGQAPRAVGIATDGGPSASLATQAPPPTYSQPPPANTGSTRIGPPPPPSAAMDVDQKGYSGGQPAKRKMDERDLNPDELEQRETRRPAPFEQASESVESQQKPLPLQQPVPPPPQPQSQQQQLAPPPVSHPLPPRPSVVVPPRLPAKFAKRVKPEKEKHKRYTEMPVWARQYDGGPLNKPNLIVRKPGNGHANGGQAAGSSSRSGHASPEVARGSLSAAAAAAGVPADAAAAAAAVVAANESRIALLGPWEESITGEKPYEELSRKVADFLFLNVVRNPSIAEIEGLGVQFEIEAKLGTLISKETNQRVALPVASECLLQDTGRWAFRSSMTEAQHKAYNDFLNGLVCVTDARNPANAGRAKPRVPVVYKHRREVDRFYELPLDLQERLPACVRTLLPHGRHQAVKVRVTTDKRTGAELGKIVKARIHDLNIHFPDAALDCRISVNLEMAWDGATGELEQRAAALMRERAPDRDKDRLSYNQSHYQIDLTQVTYKVQGPNKMERDEKEHELEIELAPAMVIEQGRRAARGEPHAYQELVDGFVDNVRTLARRTQPA